LKKVDIGANTFVFPMPVTLLGSQVNAKPNFMALGWLTRVNADPPMIGMGVGKHHYTCSGIAETKTFSINFPNAEMMEITDYCGIVSGEKADKAGLFHVFYGKLKTTPMIEECPLCLECELIQTIEFPTNTFYIGEIVGAYAGEGCLTEGRPDIKRIDPLLLTMPDNRYWKVGDYAGKAFCSGKDYKKRR
jgi:flavin reductase (DIM6/NTAB) family NADH-FMN oxidoreductase RutF